jgi:hypothetical protein
LKAKLLNIEGQGSLFLSQWLPEYEDQLLNHLLRTGKSAELYSDGLQSPGYAEEFFSALQTGTELPSPRFISNTRDRQYENRFIPTYRGFRMIGRAMDCLKEQNHEYHQKPEEECNANTGEGQELTEPWVYKLVVKGYVGMPTVFVPWTPSTSEVRDDPLFTGDRPDFPYPGDRSDFTGVQPYFQPGVSLLRVSKLANDHYAGQMFEEATGIYFDGPNAAGDAVDCYDSRAIMFSGSGNVDKVNKEKCQGAFYLLKRLLNRRIQASAYSNEDVTKLFEPQIIRGVTLYPTVINGRLSRISHGDYFIGRIGTKTNLEGVTLRRTNAFYGR